MYPSVLMAELPVTVDPEIMSGIPVFQGTRVPVQTLFDYLLDDCTLAEFLDNFPTVSEKAAHKLLVYAARLTTNRVTVNTVTIPEIVECLQLLSAERLLVVYDFVSYLTEKEQTSGMTNGNAVKNGRPVSEALLTMLASEPVLRRDWDRPEEDEAWADL